jgi:hypothetical protein
MLKNLIDNLVYSIDQVVQTAQSQQHKLQSTLSKLI